MSREQSCPRVRFGLFRFDTDNGELRREGHLVRLQPQPARVLAALLETPGRLVEREELKRRLWGDEHVEFDAGINFSIRQIRQALSDSAESPRYLQTVRGRGYRFIGPVEVIDSRPVGKRRRTLLTAAAVAAALTVLAILGATGLTDRLAKGVLTALPSQLGKQVGADSPSRPAPSPEVRAELLKGRYQLDKNTGEGLAKAVEHFEKAIGLAPDYAQGYLDLAIAVGSCPYRSYGGPDRERELLETALGLDPKLAEGHSKLGTVQFFAEWNWEGARRSFETALALDPSLSSAQKGLAFYYSSRGEHQAAIDHVEKALLLDPVSVNLRADLGWFFYRARRYASARTQCLETLELEPEDPSARACLTAVALAQGDAAEAWSRVRAELVSSDFPSRDLEELDGLAAANPAGAIHRYRAQRVARLEDSTDSISPWSLAVAHAELDNRDRALHWLEKAYDQGSGSMPFIAIAPPLDSLRSDPRFRDLLERLDLPSDLVLLPTAVGP